MNFFPFVPVDVSAMFSGLSVLPGPCPVSGEVFTHVVMQLFWGVLGCVFIGSPPHCTRGDRAYRVNLNPGMTGSLPYSGACGFALGFGEIQGICPWPQPWKDTGLLCTGRPDASCVFMRWTFRIAFGISYCVSMSLNRSNSSGTCHDTGTGRTTAGINI